MRVGAKGCDFHYLNPARLRLLPQRAFRLTSRSRAGLGVRSRVRVGAKDCDFHYLNPARLRLLPQTGLSANESQPPRKKSRRL